MERTLTNDSGSDETVPESPRVVRIRVRYSDTKVAWIIIAFAVVWRFWAAMQWTFRGDDWGYFYAASKIPFLHLVTLQHAGHLQPGQWILIWLSAKIAPLNF